MHAKLVDRITKFAKERDIFVTMETEGSHAIKPEVPINLVSLSPKFSNSVPIIGVETPMGKIVDQKFVDVHNRSRLNLDVMRELIDYNDDYHFKPVWDGTQQNINEIEEFRVKMNIPKSKTYVMPAGDTRETLIEMYPKVFELCAAVGYRMTGRDHIIAFDTDREV